MHAQRLRELRQAYKGAAARMSSPYVGRSLSRTRGDGMCGGTPFVLVGSWWLLDTTVR